MLILSFVGISFSTLTATFILYTRKRSYDIVGLNSLIATGMRGNRSSDKYTINRVYYGPTTCSDPVAFQGVTRVNHVCVNRHMEYKWEKKQFTIANGHSYNHA